MTTKVMLGIAAYKTVRPQTFRSAVAVAGDSRFWEGDYEFSGYVVAEGYGTPVNLERIFTAALEVTGSQGLLFYHDSDMVFGTETIESHLDVYEKICHATGHRRHVVAAVYPRSYDRTLTVGVRSDDRSRYRNLPEWPGVYEASCIGFGFVLIPTCVFQHWSRPWAEEEMSMERQYTPDTMFGGRALDDGCGLWLNENAPVKHYVTEVF